MLDSSRGREPLAYLHGAGNIVPGLEEAMAGRQAGDAFKVDVQPEDGYGLHHEGLVQDVPRAAFQGVDSIEPGMSFQAQTPQGVHSVTVTKVTNDTITVDGNHPLAGQTLHFMSVKPQVLEGDKDITVIDKDFIPAKSFKSYSAKTTMPCYKTGVMADCCKPANGAAADKRVYHVTI